MSESKPKQKLWFDPKNPPKTPIYVGQRIPIYIVPDDTDEDDRLVEPTWKKTDWVFKVVAIRRKEITDDNGNVKETEVVDVEWPNKHIDTDIPMSNMYGHFARIPESSVAHFTEIGHVCGANDSDSEESEDFEEILKRMSPQEKLEQILKILIFISEYRERMRQEGKLVDENSPKVTVEETSDKVTTLDEDADKVEIQEATLVDKEERRPLLDKDLMKQLLPDLSTEAIDAFCDNINKRGDKKEDSSPEPSPVEPPSKKTTSKSAEPATKKTTSKTAEPASKKTTSKTAEPASKKTTSKTAEPATKKTSSKTAEPATKKTSSKTVESSTKKTTSKTVEPAKKTSSKTAEPATKKIFELNKDTIITWCGPPAKGGLRISELRQQASELGIKEPQKLKKAEIETEMLKLLKK